MSLQDNIAQLKKLTTDKKIAFDKAVNYFVSNIAENNETDKVSEMVTDKQDFFIQMLQPILTKHHIIQKKLTICVLAVKAQQFFHGFLTVPNLAPLVFFFFADINVGIATLADWNGKCEHYRITMFEGKHTTTDPIIMTKASTTLQ